jgi:ABC-type uncharacterized transport system substrate-binding protein
MRRRDLVRFLAGAAVLAPPIARARQKPMPVIGFLHSGSPGQAKPNVAAFHEGLSESGYVVGKNVDIEYSWAETHYDRLPALAADLVAHDVDVIVAGGGTPPTLAAKQASTTIPIVFANFGNPVAAGVVASLARPGGNLTGISIMFAELTLKRIELMSELVSGGKSFALLLNPKNPTNELAIGDPRQTARDMGIELSILEATTDREIDTAFASLRRLGAAGLIVSPDPLFLVQRERVIALASQSAIPAMYGWREFVRDGGLISYAPSITATYRQAALLVAKILKGAKPADLPVEQPAKFELVINLKTAKLLGLTIPPSLLARADEVIE